MTSVLRLAHRLPFSLLTCLWLVCLAMVSMTGCGGCDPQSPEASARRLDSKRDSAADSQQAAENFRDLNKKKPDFEIGELLPRLSSRSSAEVLPRENFLLDDAFQGAGDGVSGEDLLPSRLFKPGHWTDTVQAMKSNDHDFVGRVTMTPMDADNRPLAWDDTPFAMKYSRPIALAQSRKKWVEGKLLISGSWDEASLNWTLQQRGSLTAIRQQRFPPLTRMPPYQYFLVVLAKEPGRYGYLQVADTVRAPWEDEQGGLFQQHYQVLLFDGTRSLPLPADMLAWISLALMVWDEVDPNRLTPDQQRALVDWLHWGGRLVISGPGSLATLRGSFLDSYLPATSDETRLVTGEMLRAWNTYWVPPASFQAATTPQTGSQTARTPPAGEDGLAKRLLPIIPWPAVILKPRPGSVEVPGTAGLFYECSVGKGSLLVSAISLATRNLVQWHGFDNFLNGALLRRPRRRFVVGPYGGVCVDWVDYPNRRFDSHFTTGVRLFARDEGGDTNSRSAKTTLPIQPSTQIRTRPRSQVQAGEKPSGGSGRPGGMGAWNDFGAVSCAARAALLEAAGVRVPAASFVLVCLAVYLLVLVPLNWMVFRALGHVEWAWIAAPIIALLGTLIVIRQAQLDIGFVRAQTELGVLELAGDYPRGHLSRYTALYTSLSTTYNVQFDDPWAVATPFPARRNDPTLAGQPPAMVNLALRPRVQLQVVAISSASTRLVHSEQMIALEGPLQWRNSSQGHQEVVNRTGLNLDDCLLIHHRAEGKSPRMGCWLGQLRSGQSAVVHFHPLPVPGTPRSDGSLPYASARARAARDANPPRLNIDPILKIACQWNMPDDPWVGARDEFRLVARIDRPLPGCQISPTASQIRGATLIIAHLAYGDLPIPKPDMNGRWDLADNEGTEPP